MTTNKYLIAIILCVFMCKLSFAQGIDFKIEEGEDKFLSSQAKEYHIKTRELYATIPINDSFNQNQRRIEYYNKEGKRYKTEYFLDDVRVVESLKFDSLSQLVNYTIYRFAEQGKKDSVLTTQCINTYKDTLITSKEILSNDQNGKFTSRDIEKYYYNYSRKVKTETFSYNKKGKIQEKSITRYYHDEAAQVVLESTIKNNKDTSNVVYEYNKNGQVICKRITYRDKSNYTFKPYGYDKFGNPVKGDSFDITEFKTTFEYDDFGNIIHQNEFGNGILKTEYIQKYNSDNLLIEETGEHEFIPFPTSFYEYDTQNRLIKITEQSPFSNESVIRSDSGNNNVTIFEYNSLGLKIKESIKQGRNHVAEIEVSYTFY